MPEAKTVWIDSRGNHHNTLVEAELANAKDEFIQAMNTHYINSIRHCDLSAHDFLRKIADNPTEASLALSKLLQKVPELKRAK